MADRIASALAQNLDSMPLLAHLEELRKRIILSVVGVVVGFFSCWSFADRIFALMQQPIIQALRHHGLSGGLVYLNPTEPFCGCSLLPGCIAKRSVMFCPFLSVPSHCF